jgi:hypothetical protein
MCCIFVPLNVELKLCMLLQNVDVALGALWVTGTCQLRDLPVTRHECRAVLSNNNRRQ